MQRRDSIRLDFAAVLTDPGAIDKLVAESEKHEIILVSPLAGVASGPAAMREWLLKAGLPSVTVKTVRFARP